MNVARVTVRAFVALAFLALARLATGQASSTDAAWRPFEGEWSAAGTRQTLPTEGAAPAAIVSVSGAVVIGSGEGLSRGFRGEAIFFWDGATLGVGRCVWTDDRGDRIFCALKGDALETGRRITGTLTGGTGRYAGISGEFSFPWQYVVQAEDGVISGRTASLKGRFRLAGGPR